MKNRRQVLVAAAASVPGFAMPFRMSRAEEPIRILVGFPPGAAADTMSRIIAEGMSGELKTPVIVESRVGAGGAIAARALKAAPADGRTMLFVNSHMLVTLPLTSKSPGYDPVQDFKMLGRTDTTPLAVVAPAGSFASIKNWLDTVKANPAGGNYAIPAPGSSPEFLGFRLASDSGVKLVAVSYRGNAPMITDLLGKQVPVGITTLPDLVTYHKAGRLKVLAVASNERHRSLPDVPTLTESGFPGLDRLQWAGMAVASGTPPAMLEKLRTAFRTVMQRTKTAEGFAASGNYVDYANHETTAQLLESDLTYWGKLIKDSGFVPQ